MIADKDVKKEKGKLLLQLDDLYERALASNQLNVCVAVIKQKIAVLGLEHINFNVKADVNTQISVTRLRESWQRIKDHEG